jgi:uncharacterized protein DUF4407/TIR domain-containing protein
MLSKLKKFLIMCSGASQEILDRPECALEYPKYLAIGAAVLSTAVLSVLSASYSLYLSFRSLPLSLFVGLLWGGVMFNLERYLVATLRRKRIPPNLSLGERIRRRSGELLAHLPRVLLTVLVSFVIAFPLELRVFQREIEAQLERHALSIVILSKSRLLEQYPDVKTLQADNEQLIEEIQIKQKQTDDLQQALLDQVRSNSNERVYNHRRSAFLRSESELDALKKENQTKLETNRKRLGDLQSKVDEQAEQIRQATYFGLVARIEAFNELKSEHSSIAVGNVLILALFALLLASPILLKLFAEVGPYEQFVEAIEAMAYKESGLTASPDNDGGESTRVRAETVSTGGDVELRNRALLVFLCHSSHDKPAIRELQKRLAENHIEPWLDEQNILPGQDWNHEIIGAVRKCDVVLICLSRGSTTKKGICPKRDPLCLGSRGRTARGHYLSDSCQTRGVRCP